MNKDNAAQFLPLVQALAEGKTIQINDGTSDSPKWVDFGFDDICFGSDPDYYRIKPDQPEWDVWVNGPSITETDMGAYSGWQKTRVREIID